VGVQLSINDRPLTSLQDYHVQKINVSVIVLHIAVFVFILKACTDDYPLTHTEILIKKILEGRKLKNYLRAVLRRKAVGCS
jgi:hypothetical protein